MMPNMKLTLAAEQQHRDPRRRDPQQHRDPPPQLDKEAVFEWFGLQLNPARRLEFLCGLMHMCQPLELRFVGSYLEDLARKDYHVLRDSEFRANSPAELGLLTAVLDPVVRSKLLVCVSLLGSDSRDCAGILFRILGHAEPARFRRHRDRPLPAAASSRGFSSSCSSSSGGESAEEKPGALEQLALLYTMAALHPAFHFHQREALRAQLDKIELLLEEEEQQEEEQERRRLEEESSSRRRREQEQEEEEEALTAELQAQNVDYLPPQALGLGDSHPSCQSRRSGRWALQREAVHIEGIMLLNISRTRLGKEYHFEVKWSDSSFSKVTKNHLELENFLLKLPKDQCADSFEKGILRLLNQSDQYEVEENLRERFLSAPPLFRQTRKVCSFFNCGSSYSAKPSSCRSNCQLGKAYQGDCSDASSQEEDLEFVQGHKKKHGAKSPCQALSSAKGPQGEGRRGCHSAELSGPAERRKKGCTLRSGQEAEQQQDTEKRSSTATKTKNRDKAKGAAYVTNGSLAPAISPQKKDGASGPDTFGETSSESYSSPSSPQHRGPESLDSEDDNNKDTDSHSDDSSKGRAPGVFFGHQADAPVVGEVFSMHPGSEGGVKFPPLSFMHPLPYALPNGAGDPQLLPVPPPSQNLLHDGKAAPGPLVTQMPLAPPAVPGAGLIGDPEKRDILPTFGISTLGPPGGQPLVQRFKTALTHSQAGPDGASGSGPTAVAPIRANSIMSVGPASYPSPPQPALPCQDPPSATPGLPSTLPLVENSHAKHPCLTLPSPYTLPPAAPPVMPTVGAPPVSGIIPSPGHIQAAVPPAVPTHTPGPAPSPSPALTHSTAHSDCISYSNSSASCGSAPVTPGNPLTLQQTQQQQVAPQQPAPPPQQQQQQQPMGCGTCGCHNNCGSRGGNSVSACQAPLFFPAHQMAAAARQVFSVPPPLFHLTSLCSNSYLTQAQPPHQANGAATLPPFFPTAPPPARPPPYGPLHTHTHSHSHSHADVPSHMLGTQAAAVAAVAAANYNLQQQMAPAASFCQRVYQHVYPNPLGMLPAATLGGGGVNKKNGNVSCYNCGVSGHYAQECNQPSIDSTQQGGFRLKYTASHVSEALDSAD